MITRSEARHREHASAAQWVHAVSSYRITTTYLAVAMIVLVLLLVV